MTPSNRELCEGIRPDQTPETILKTLQTIASMDEVPAVAIRCWELTQHDDEEIRSWATECLSSSIQPQQDEEPFLLDALDAELNSSKAGTAPTESLYWLVTLTGRLSLDDSELRERAKTLLVQAATLDDCPAAERAKRITQRWS